MSADADTGYDATQNRTSTQTPFTPTTVIPMVKSSGCFKAKVAMDSEILKQLVLYDENTGKLLWRHGCGKRVQGAKVGVPDDKGYLRVSFFGRKYQVHRLIWLYVHGYYPCGIIDHIDGDPNNNRIDNLREGTQSQNCSNSRRSVRNTSGYKGVSLHHNKLWRAYVTTKGKTHWLGYFKTKEEAFSARVAAANRLHGEYARHK